MSLETRSSFGALLMTDYRPGVCTGLMFRDNTPAEAIFKRRERSGGDKLSRPVITRRAGTNVKHHADGGTTATAAQRQKTTAEDTIKFVTGSYAVSQHLINVTKQKSLAYLEAVDNLVTEAVDDIKNMIMKDLFAASGFYGDVASGSSTSVTMATGTNMDQFEEGMGIAVLVRADGTTGNGHAGTTVSAVNKSTRVITTADAMAGSLDTTYGVCATGNVDGSTNLTPNGLRDIVSESTVHGVDVSTYTTYISYVKDLSDSLDFDSFQEMLDELEMRKGSNIDRVWGHDSLVRKYQFELVDPRSLGRPGEGLGGTGKITFKGRSNKILPIEALVYCNPIDGFYFIEDAAIECFYTAFTEWMSDDTGKILHKIANTAGYAADYGCEYQIMSPERYKLGLLDNIT